MRRLIIGPPFGNYLSFAGATSVLGTYTLHRRAGVIGRLWRALRTVRYRHGAGSWVNKMGLPSPGIDSIPYSRDLSDKVVSVHGFGGDEWYGLVNHLLFVFNCREVELNLSCPNVRHKVELGELVSSVELALRHGMTVVAKLPSVRWMDLAAPLYDAGVRYFHCCNSIPTDRGGVSGKPLKPISLWAVAELKDKWGTDVDVIGGGGVTDVEDVRDYIQAGADRVSVASMLFNPLNWLKIKHMVAALERIPRD